MNALIAAPSQSRGDVDLNDVALLVRVVQSGSFSAAARERGVPVSTVSRRIARLEGRLGTRLLERTTRRVRVTEVGRTYVTHAERALEELTQGSHHVRAAQAVPRGRVRITAPVGLSALLADVLSAYLASAPLVSVDLDLTDRRVDLIAEDMDIALRSGPVDSPDFVAKKVVDSRRHLFASKAYLEKRGRPKHAADLTAHDLIATRSSPSGAVWELFRASDAETARAGKSGRQHREPLHRLSFKPRLAVNELMAAKHAAVAGAGITLLPAHECAKHLRHGDLERVLPDIEGPRGGMWLLYRANRSLTAAVRSCLEHLLEGISAVKGMETISTRIAR